MYINYDLENFPLQVKTNSRAGSDQKVWVDFYTIGGDYAGGVILYFTSPPKYLLGPCTPRNNYPIALPSETDRIWRIQVSKTSDVRVTIHCNNKEVLNVVLSDAFCIDNKWRCWSRDVQKAKFNAVDTASDFYIPGK